MKHWMLTCGCGWRSEIGDALKTGNQLFEHSSCSDADSIQLHNNEDLQQLEDFQRVFPS